ncbi:MAG: pyrroloquinoline quinone (PQQ) biosynthesis protein C [Arenicella sp.]|jgi:pyrroloquinoline quinone (PQQ) biosynthesis protein C
MVAKNVAAAGISQQDKESILSSLPSVSHAEQVIREAINDKGGQLWAKLQESLFDMNVRLMKDGFALGTDRAEVEWKFRNLTERLEKEARINEPIPEHLEDPEEFLVWLKGGIAEHRVNHHSLFNYFDNDELTDEEIRYFLSNYRVNMQRFHLHVAAYSLFVPFEMREELYENLHDEFGEGNFDEAHPNLFEPLMDHFGGARPEDWNPETFHLLNTKMSLCWFADGLHSGMGGMGALELSIPAQQRRVLGHLRRRGLSKELVKFFVVHCELDEDHGDGWFAAGLPYMNTKEEFQKVYDAAIRMLDARAGVYDGILKGIETRRALKEAA